ncbi:MAG: hypothetical protein NVSMB19_18510 [Vulcanimicrobiaceae bacterium]
MGALLATVCVTLLNGLLLCGPSAPLPGAPVATAAPSASASPAPTAAPALPLALPPIIIVATPTAAPTPPPSPTPIATAAPTPTPTPTAVAVKFGGFARLAPGSPPFAMFSAPGVLDPQKTSDLLDLGATWTRSPLAPFFDDRTAFGAGHYDFGSADTVLTWDVAHAIEPVVGLEAGPVQVNATPGTFSPHQVPIYPTPAAFATYCTAVATHVSTFSHSYSSPGNETNSDPQKYPGGASDVAPYAAACYHAIHAADPTAFVWGLELNMDGQAGATKFVSDLLALGCGPGTCYDGLSAHLSLRYPIPAKGTPCFPAAGGDYDVACLSDLQGASGDPFLPLMIGETAVTWPGMVPDAATQALAAPAELKALAAAPGVRYIDYANIDECALYPSGYFMNGCIVDATGAHVPAWQAVHAVFLGAR